jgi:hypothetical protein
MPPNGSVIAHHGMLYASQVVVGGFMYPRNGGETHTTLYYDPPMRGNGATDPTRFHLVGDLARYAVPSHWIMIATFDGRGAGYDDIRLGTGRVINFNKQQVTNVGTFSSAAAIPATASETNWATITIPNPVNGRTYRAMAVLAMTPNTAGQFSSIFLKWGAAAGTGGTQFGHSYTDFRAIARVASNTVMGEFVYTGATGATNINIVATFLGGGGTIAYGGFGSRYMSVDEIGY